MTNDRTLSSFVCLDSARFLPTSIDQGYLQQMRGDQDSKLTAGWRVLRGVHTIHVQVLVHNDNRI